MFINYNDYELIYLYKEGIECAYTILVEKYNYLIQKIARGFYIPDEYMDDAIQEGRIKLLEAINKYRDDNKTSFFTYFIILLTRRYVNIFRKNKPNKLNMYDFTLQENINEYDSSSSFMKKIKLLSRMIDFKSDVDRLIFNECIIEGFSIKGFCLKYNLCYSKMSYRYNYLINEIKKILTISQI